MLIRLPGWEHRLAIEIATSLNMPFAWHDNDCCSFCARCVSAVTRTDLFEIFRGSYRGRTSAIRALKQHGGIVAICDALLGDRRPKLTAQRGDVLLVTTGEQDAIAICYGRNGLMPGPLGLIERPQHAWIACWKIECQ